MGRCGVIGGGVPFSYLNVFLSLKIFKLLFWSDKSKWSPSLLLISHVSKSIGGNLCSPYNCQQQGMESRGTHFQLHNSALFDFFHKHILLL